MGVRTTRWISAIGAAALLAACGGAGEEGADAGEQQLDVGGVETESPDAPDEPTDVDPPEVEEPSEPDDVEEPEPTEEAATAPGPRQPVKVTYAGTSIDDGTLTLVYDRDRFAIHFDDGRIIQTTDETIFCSAPGEPCISTPSGAGMVDSMTAGLGSFLDFSDAIEQGGSLPGSWQQIDGRTIAGRDATCAEFETNDLVPGSGDGTASYCFDAELGVGLSWTFAGPDGTETMEATEVTSPTDEDFAPTGPVESLDPGT